MKLVVLSLILFASSSLYAQEIAPAASSCEGPESAECMRDQLTALSTEVASLKERLDRVSGERDAAIANALVLLELPQSHPLTALVRKTQGFWQGGRKPSRAHECRSIEPKEYYKAMLLERTFDIGRRKGECMPASSNECDSKGERCEETIVGGCYVREDLVTRMVREGRNTAQIVTSYCPGATEAFEAAAKAATTPR